MPYAVHETYEEVAGDDEQLPGEADEPAAANSLADGSEDGAEHGDGEEEQPTHRPCGFAEGEAQCDVGDGHEQRIDAGQLSAAARLAADGGRNGEVERNGKQHQPERMPDVINDAQRGVSAGHDHGHGYVEPVKTPSAYGGGDGVVNGYREEQEPCGMPETLEEAQKQEHARHEDREREAGVMLDPAVRVLYLLIGVEHDFAAVLVDYRGAPFAGPFRLLLVNEAALAFLRAVPLAMDALSVLGEGNAVIVHLYVIYIIVYKGVVAVLFRLVGVLDEYAVPAYMHARAVVIGHVDAVVQVDADVLAGTGVAGGLFLLGLGAGDLLVGRKELIQRYAVEAGEHYKIIGIGGGFRPLPFADRLTGDAELGRELLL